MWAKKPASNNDYCNDLIAIVILCCGSTLNLAYDSALRRLIMRRVRMSSNSLPIFACALLILLLQASSIVLAGGAATHTQSSNLIRVWTIASPHTGTLPPARVPPDLRQRAKELGYTVEVETFQASGFAAKFRQALLDHSEPEILTFDNYGVISGVRTPNGWVEGVDADGRVASSLVLVHESLASLQQRGWVMLIRSAVNYEAALALSMRPAECNSGAADSLANEPALRQVQEKAVFATRAYLDCDRSTLSAISDESRLVEQCFLPKSNVRVESVKACRVSGNYQLAFVSLVSNFSATVREPDTTGLSKQGMDLGQQSILAVLRNQNGTWRLLAITHDALNTVAAMRVTNTNLFLNSLDQGQSTGIMPEAARPLTPNGVVPLPPKGERFGDFTWQPSPSSEVIGQVVEFALGKTTNWGFTRLFFLPASENKISTGLLMNGGLSTWRVWSISKTGDIAFSEQHSFLF